MNKKPKPIPNLPQNLSTTVCVPAFVGVHHVGRSLLLYCGFLVVSERLRNLLSEMDPSGQTIRLLVPPTTLTFILLC